MATPWPGSEVDDDADVDEVVDDVDVDDDDADDETGGCGGGGIKIASSNLMYLRVPSANRPARVFTAGKYRKKLDSKSSL